jgi:glucosamine--fructose-6-phosphate aminotransferase (isomerizing)
VGQKPIKAVGPIANLAELVPENFPGTTGIAHTRWATHGAPTKANAHPHTGAEGSIAIVHNGIIENFRELKEGLLAQGIIFTSETDTEVLAKLIGSLYSGDLKKAVQAALKRVRGTYGLIAASEADPHQVIVARMGSPVVLGLSDEGNFVSSDPSALLQYTKNVVYLEDGDMAVVTLDSYTISTIAGAAVTRVPETVDWDVESIQKQGYEHFMLKEINEAAEVIKNTTRGRMITKEGKVKLGGLEVVLDQIKGLDRLIIVGCGSAYYAAEVGRYMLEEYAGIPVEVEFGSEYRYKNNLQTGKTAVLAITQSGETADTLASIRKAKAAGLLTLGIVNTVGSTIARETDAGVHNHAGPEIAVASTKAFLSQLAVLVLLTVLIGRENGSLPKVEATTILTGLQKLPAVIDAYLKDVRDIDLIAKKYANYSNAMFIGRKFHAPIADEGALKLKEVTYIHAEAYAGGELKHGSIALLDKHFPVIAIAPQDDVYAKMVSNIEEAKARSAPTLVIATKGDITMKEVADDVLYIPKVHPILQPIITTIPLQLLAYKIGIEKGLNVDRPRNLAKSVTVE